MLQKIIFLVLLLGSITFAQTNIVDSTIAASTYRGTLTTATDTMDLKFSNTAAYTYHTVLVYCTAGADTVEVYVQVRDQGGEWSRISLIDKPSGSTVTSIAASTTKKEFILLDSYLQKIRYISTSDDGSSTVIVTSIK